MFKQLYHYALLIRLHRPYPLFLLLWPVWWGLWLAAGGTPQPHLLAIFTAGTVLMRSAGCIINDWVDQGFDGQVTRTKQRPLITGAVSNKEAIILTVCLCLLAFILVLQLNRQTIALSFVALALCVIYPFMKRYTHFPQVVLGMAWYTGILMTFTATLGYIPLVGWLLYWVGIIWAVVYDTMYAMVDRDDDLKIGIKSTAIAFAQYDRFIIGLLQLLILVLLALIGYITMLKLPYFISLIVGAGFFIYQQYLIRDSAREGCLAAFNNNHWFGLTVFAGLFCNFPPFSLFLTHTIQVSRFS